MKSQSEKQQKKTYLKPGLKVYGSLQQITKAVGNSGMTDGGSGSTMRSQP